MQVAPPHNWYGQSVGGSRILYDNPDTVYRFMAVNKTSTYVISGKFEDWDPEDPTTRSGRHQLQPVDGVVGEHRGRPDQRRTRGQRRRHVRDLRVGRPAAARIQELHSAHVGLHADCGARHVGGTGTKNNRSSLSIVRSDGPPDSLFAQLGGFAIPLIGPAVTDSPALTQLVSIIPPLADPPPLLRGAVTAVIMVLGLSMERDYMRVATVDPVTGERRQPNKLTDPTSNAAFLSTQLQSAGYFQLEDDEALVVTINPGNADYFTVPVTNDWTITENYWDQQTSLNNGQASLANPDGTYTIVISQNGSRLDNWVSTGGLNQGTISIRFQDLAESGAMPTVVSSEVVTHDELRPDVLPPEDFIVPRGSRPHTRDRKASTGASRPSRRHRTRVLHKGCDPRRSTALTQKSARAIRGPVSPRGKPSPTATTVRSPAAGLWEAIRQSGCRWRRPQSVWAPWQWMRRRR